MSGIKKCVNLTALASNGFNIFIDGKKNRYESQFLDNFGKQIRYKSYLKWQAYVDDMKGLDWIDNSQINIVIYNWPFFLKNSRITQKEFLEDYSDDILPYWEEELSMDDAGNRDIKNVTIYITEKNLSKELIELYKKNNTCHDSDV